MLQVIFYCLLGIVGTAIGALLGIFFGKRMLGGTLALTAGIMVGLVIFDLFPLSVRLSDIIIALLSTAIGVIGVLLLNAGIEKIHPLKSENKMINTGMVLLFSMALHNFPEGMAIGSGSAESAGTGFLVALAIGLHDLPEGMAVAAPFVGGKLKNRKVFFLTLFSGFSTVFGALLGFFLGNLSVKMNAVALGFASGAMLCVVFRELLPEARKNASLFDTVLYLLSGILISIILISTL
ncbi:MAG TPA: ZIP family metal transporter [Bacilli bacterium]